MKNTIILILTIFCFSVVNAQDQAVPTLKIPGAKPSITQEKIIEMGNMASMENTTSAVIVLNFEGLGDEDHINDFYNGGTSGTGNSGTNYGVQFTYGALGLIDSDAGGTGNFANEPSPSTIMFFLTDFPVLNFPAGFTTGFSFYYTSSVGCGVEVYDGVNATGTLLASGSFPVSYGGTGDPTGTFATFTPVGVSFSGTAKSIKFTGGYNQTGFDDITFGSPTPGCDDELTAVSLQKALDPAGTWSPVAGTLETGYDMICIDPTGDPVQNYFLDVDGITVSGTATDLKVDEYNPFFLDVNSVPADFYAYWTAKNVFDGCTGTWEPFMWEIIDGQEPMFYLVNTGTDYILIDGLHYLLNNATTEILRLPGDYPAGDYAFIGHVTFDTGCGQDLNVMMAIGDDDAPTPVCKSIAVTLEQDGTVSIVPEDVDGGSTDNCEIASLSATPLDFDCEDVGDNDVILTVTDLSGNSSTCTAVVTVKERETTLTYYGEWWKDYSDIVYMKAKLVDVLTSTGIPGMDITFTIGTQSVTAETNADGVAYANIKLDQPAGPYTVVSEFTGECPYLPAIDKDPFKITKESACATYSGVRIASTGSTNSNVAQVLLAATITDWPDGMPGDIINNAQVNFVRATTTWPFYEVIAGPLDIGLITEGDHTIGSVNAWWTVTLSSTVLWKTDLVWVQVIGDYYFNKGICTDPTLITVYRPGPEFITGGGYLILEKPAGTFGADVGSKNNFGFNVKYNKKGTTLQGNINTIIRKMVDGEELVYHVKGNKMGSLSVLKNFAVFTCQASIVDITDPELPKDVMGKCTMKVNMIDNGEPGVNDMIGITVFDKDGGMYYSSRWEKNETQMQLLANGNLAVHGSLKSAETVDVNTTTDVNLAVYPNPFTDQLRFNLIAPEDAQARIDLFDVTGRLVKTVFNSEVKAGVEYNAEFRPEARVSGIYLYRATIGEKVFNGKVSYQK